MPRGRSNGNRVQVELLIVQFAHMAVAFTVFFVVIGTMVFEKGFTHFLELFLPSGTPLGLIPILVPLELFSYSSLIKI